MTEKETPAALAGANRAIVEAANPSVSKPQTTAREALKQDGLLGPTVLQELISTPVTRPAARQRLRDETISDADIIPVILRRGGIALWKPLCPCCPEEHVHGGGTGDLDPYKLLQSAGGYRAPHCGEFGWHAREGFNPPDYRLVWRGETVHFAPGALSLSGRPTRAAKETARRLEACGIPVSYRQIGSSIPLKWWRWR